MDDDEELRSERNSTIYYKSYFLKTWSLRGVESFESGHSSKRKRQKIPNSKTEEGVFVNCRRQHKQTEETDLGGKMSEVHTGMLGRGREVAWYDHLIINESSH